MNKEEFKVSNMFIDSLKTQQELYYKAKIEKIYQQKLKDLQQKVEQLENIRKEIKEYIEKNVVCFKNGDMLVELNVDDLLNILNKGENNE